MKSTLLALAIGAALTNSAAAQINSFCTAQNNSSGTPAALAVSGSINVTDNGLTFAISSLPSFNYNMAQRGTFGVLLASRSFNSTGTMPANSMGTLCLTSFAFSPSAVIAGDALGAAAGAIDLTSLPASLGAVLPGDTLAFQAWYRDVDTSMGMLRTTSNFTNAVEVEFAPLPPSFASDIVPILRATANGCLNCHGNNPLATAPQDFRFTDPPSTLHGRLVGVSSSLASCVGSFPQVRVTAGDADQSTLFRLVSNNASCAALNSSMDITNSAQVALIEEWIEAGAPNN